MTRGVSPVWRGSQDGSFETWMEQRRLLNHPEERDTPEEQKETVPYFVGVDLGKKHDPSTVAIVEQRRTPSNQSHYYVKHLKRFRLRMLYTNVAATLAKMDRQLKAHAAKQDKRADIVYALDAGGVGEGVAELVEREMPAAYILKCYLTGGINPTIDQREVHLPKAQMVSTLVALFDAKRIHLTKRSTEIGVMLDELRDYEIHVSEKGHDQFGAFKVGQHDDMVTALALAVWSAEQARFQPVRFW